MAEISTKPAQMSLRATIRSRPLLFLFGFAAATLLVLAAVPPIPQSQIYHGFADSRTLFGIANFWNVATNVPFVIIGAMGLWNIRRDLSASLFFLGVFLTGFSSSYYHWQPNDWGLFWDRLPMSIAFMAILANVIEERVDERAGKALLWPLVALGLVSLIVWLRTDDLRLYAWVQFFPCLAVPLTFALFAPKYTGTHYWFAAAGFYLVAKLLELFDSGVYAALHVMSGHPLKHVTAACACYSIYLAFRTRQPMDGRITTSIRS